MSTLYTDRLSGKHIGVFFGTFAPASRPLSKHHQAKRETDGCLVIVSGYPGDRGDLIGLSLQKDSVTCASFLPKKKTSMSPTWTKPPLPVIRMAGRIG